MDETGLSKKWRENWKVLPVGFCRLKIMRMMCEAHVEGIMLIIKLGQTKYSR